MEEKTLFRALAFWVAVTNPKLNVPLGGPEIKQLADMTGLQKIEPKKFNDAVDYVNKNAKAYQDIKTEFDKFRTTLIYVPGQCPRDIMTLKKFADHDPNS